MNIKEADKPIVIIDSGMGAVIIERKLDKLFPAENKIIIMDNEFLPYGNKSELAITRRVSKLMKEVRELEPKMIIIGCNTMDSIAADQILFDANGAVVVQIVYNTAYKAIVESKNKKIAVLATKASIESKAYHYGCALHAPNTNVIGVQCDNLASSIEHNENIKKVFNEEVAILENEEFDTIILGCTHYSRIKPLVSKQFKDVNIIDSTDVVVQMASKQMDNVIKQKDHRIGTTKIIMTKDENKDYINKLYSNVEIEKWEIKQ